LFEPDAGLTFSHASELAALHPVLDVTLNMAVLLAFALTLNVAGETDKLGAACVTVIVCEATPVADTVTVA
jgi:hypothetical protein